MKKIELEEKYFLDLGGSAPVEVETLCFTIKGVMCKYLSSSPGRVEELGYELFEFNGYERPQPTHYSGFDANNYENLNGTPEQRIPLSEGLEYLGGSGFTSTIASHPDFNNNNIIFYAGHNNEMMRINPDGFYWKGKLVEEDKEIYLKVKEFLKMI